VDFQCERVDHVAQRPARRHPFQRGPALLGLHRRAGGGGTPFGLGLVRPPPSLYLEQRGYGLVAAEPRAA